MMETLLTLALFTTAVCFIAYWKGYAKSQRQVRWLRQELLRAESIAELLKDAVIESELEHLLKAGK